MSKAPVIQEERPKAEATGALTEVPTCQHHWLIDSPRGATSLGRCKRCGEEREFRNSAQDYMWEDESSGGYNAWRGVRARRESSDEDDGSAMAPARDVAMAL